MEEGDRTLNPDDQNNDSTAADLGNGAVDLNQFFADQEDFLANYNPELDNVVELPADAVRILADREDLADSINNAQAPANNNAQTPTNNAGRGRRGGRGGRGRRGRPRNAAPKTYGTDHVTTMVRNAEDGYSRVARMQKKITNMNNDGIALNATDPYTPARKNFTNDEDIINNNVTYMEDANGNVVKRTTENRFSIVENLEENMKNNNCGPALDNWMFNQITATERNCVTKAMRQCADTKRMKVLFSEISSGNSTAMSLNVQDYEVIQLAKLETSRYKSVIGNALGMIVKITAPNWKRKVERKVDKDLDDKVFEWMVKNDFVQGKLSDDQAREKAEIEMKLQVKLEQYAQSVKTITNWCLRDENLNFLIKDEHIPSEDMDFWRSQENAKREEARNKGIDLTNVPILSDNEIRQVKKREIMENILRKTFNISSSEVNNRRERLDNIVEFDYQQQPGVKKVKALEKECGRLTNKILYEYSWKLANTGNQIKSSIEALGTSDKTDWFTFTQASSHMFMKNMLSLNTEYVKLFSSEHLQLSMRGGLSAGVIPPPVTQSTYMVSTDGRSSNLANMLMWPDRILWSYDSKDRSDINGTTDGISQTEIKSVIFSDYLDPIFSSWRKGFQINGGVYYSRCSYNILNATTDVNYLSANLDVGNSEPFYTPGTPWGPEVSPEIWKEQRQFWKSMYLAGNQTDEYPGSVNSMDAYSPYPGQFVKTDNERVKPFDIFRGDTKEFTDFERSSEYTYYTDDWSTKTSQHLKSTEGSFLTVKHNVTPIITKGGIDCAGSFIKMELILNERALNRETVSDNVRSETRKNVWFKDRRGLKKPKGSSKSEREITKWAGIFPKIFEISAICENGNPAVHEAHQPEWLALLFKSMASFIYKTNDEDETNAYLCLVRLNRLQLNGNVSENKVIGLLKKYLDFGVCVSEYAVLNAGTDSEIKFHGNLDYQYIMKGRSEIWSRNALTQDLTTIVKENYPIPIDHTEVWLVRVMPTLDELWRLFQYAYSDYFMGVYGCDYIRNLYEFMYVDIYSGDIKLATEEGKKVKKLYPTDDTINPPFDKLYADAPRVIQSMVHGFDALDVNNDPDYYFNIPFEPVNNNNNNNPTARGQQKNKVYRRAAINKRNQAENDKQLQSEIDRENQAGLEKDIEEGFDENPASYDEEEAELQARELETSNEHFQIERRYFNMLTWVERKQLADLYVSDLNAYNDLVAKGHDEFMAWQYNSNLTPSDKEKEILAYNYPEDYTVSVEEVVPEHIITKILRSNFQVTDLNGIPMITWNGQLDINDRRAILGRYYNNDHDTYSQAVIDILENSSPDEVVSPNFVEMRDVAQYDKTPYEFDQE